MTSDGDFIEIDYTGRVNGMVFDTTRPEDAPPQSRGSLKPAVVKLGSGQLIPGLDAFLKDKQPGSYTVTLAPEQAFGKKQASMLKLVPLTSFGKEAARLAVGMPVTIGDHQGSIKSISGGRVVVDFNHPLAGQAVEYAVTLRGTVTDPVKKVSSILKAIVGAELPISEKDGKVLVKLPKGFPGDALIKEVEKQTGASIVVEELDIKPNQHIHSDGSVHDNEAHTHDHEHGHEHGHDHAGHKH